MKKERRTAINRKVWSAVTLALACVIGSSLTTLAFGPIAPAQAKIEGPSVYEAA